MQATLLIPVRHALGLEIKLVDRLLLCPVIKKKELLKPCPIGVFRLCGLKLIYSEKAKKFCEIFTLLLSYVVPVKSKVKILQNFVAFSEYMNFIG